MDDEVQVGDLYKIHHDPHVWKVIRVRPGTTSGKPTVDFERDDGMRPGVGTRVDEILAKPTVYRKLNAQASPVPAAGSGGMLACDECSAFVPTLTLMTSGRKLCPPCVTVAQASMGVVAGAQAIIATAAANGGLCKVCARTATVRRPSGSPRCSAHKDVWTERIAEYLAKYGPDHEGGTVTTFVAPKECQSISPRGRRCGQDGKHATHISLAGTERW